jgi:hypothetical protein
MVARKRNVKAEDLKKVFDMYKELADSVSKSDLKELQPPFVAVSDDVWEYLFNRYYLETGMKIQSRIVVVPERGAFMVINEKYLEEWLKDYHARLGMDIKERMKEIGEVSEHRAAVEDVLKELCPNSEL